MDVALLEEARAVKCAVFFCEWILFAMLDEDDGSGAEQRGMFTGDQVQCVGVLVDGFVRWVEEDDVDTLLALGEGDEQACRAAVFDGVAAGDLERGKIFADGGQRGGCVFREPDVRCAAADGLNADGAGAGVEIDESRAFDAGGEDVEKRFAEAVAGGARVETAVGLVEGESDRCRR